MAIDPEVLQDMIGKLDKAHMRLKDATQKGVLAAHSPDADRIYTSRLTVELREDVKFLIGCVQMLLNELYKGQTGASAQEHFQFPSLSDSDTFG